VVKDLEAISDGDITLNSGGPHVRIASLEGLSCKAELLETTILPYFLIAAAVLSRKYQTTTRKRKVTFDVNEDKRCFVLALLHTCNCSLPQ